MPRFTSDTATAASAVRALVRGSVWADASGCCARIRSAAGTGSPAAEADAGGSVRAPGSEAAT